MNRERRKKGRRPLRRGDHLSDDGRRIWVTLNGDLHRFGGPAVEWDTGMKSWYFKGKAKYMQVRDGLSPVVSMSPMIENLSLERKKNLIFPGYSEE